jgi:hypothetical protein
MMLPKSDMFVTLRNDGPSMDERDKHWSMIVHGDGSKHLRIEEDALAAGISQRVYSDTRVIFITIIAIYIALAEKIGTPLIIFNSKLFYTSMQYCKVNR